MLSRMRPGLNELPGHLVFFGEKQLRRALADCGSSTVEIERVSQHPAPRSPAKRFW